MSKIDIPELLLEFEKRQNLESRQYSNYTREEQYIADGKHIHIPGREVCSIVARAIQNYEIRRVLEVGTGVGFFSMFVGCSIKQPGLEVFSFETDLHKATSAVANLASLGLNEFVHVYNEDFLGIPHERIEEMNPGLVFVDAWKNDYVQHFSKILEVGISPPIIFFDNAEFPKEWQDAIQRLRRRVDSMVGLKRFTIPVGNGLEVVVPHSLDLRDPFLGHF